MTYKLDKLVPLIGGKPQYWVEWWGGIIKRRYITLDSLDCPWEIDVVTGDLTT